MKLKHAFCLFCFDVLYYQTSRFSIILFQLHVFRGKIEKEKKKVAQEAGFLRTEVTGGEVRVLYLTEVLYQKRDCLVVQWHSPPQGPRLFWSTPVLVHVPDYLSMCRVFILYSQPMRYVRFVGKSMNHRLWVLDQPRNHNHGCGHVGPSQRC